MRRRTHKLGGNKTIIYIIVVVLLVAGNYLYDNFAPEQAEAAALEEVEFTESSAEAPAPKGKTAHAGWAELPTQKASNDIYVTSHLLGNNRRNYNNSQSDYHSSSHHNHNQTRNNYTTDNNNTYDNY